jgi:hypothetical protein
MPILFLTAPIGIRIHQTNLPLPQPQKETFVLQKQWFRKDFSSFVPHHVFLQDGAEWVRERFLRLRDGGIGMQPVHRMRLVEICLFMLDKRKNTTRKKLVELLDACPTRSVRRTFESLRNECVFPTRVSLLRTVQTLVLVLDVVRWLSDFIECAQDIVFPYNASLVDIKQCLVEEEDEVWSVVERAASEPFEYAWTLDDSMRQEVERGGKQTMDWTERVAADKKMRLHLEKASTKWGDVLRRVRLIIETHLPFKYKIWQYVGDVDVLVHCSLEHMCAASTATTNKKTQIIGLSEKSGLQDVFIAIDPPTTDQEKEALEYTSQTTYAGFPLYAVRADVVHPLG